MNLDKASIGEMNKGNKQSKIYCNEWQYTLQMVLFASIFFVVGLLLANNEYIMNLSITLLFFGLTILLLYIALFFILPPKNQHFHLLDFCYYGAFLIGLHPLMKYWNTISKYYQISPLPFPVCFGFANGIIGLTVPLWNLNIDPLRLDKTIINWLHLLPAFYTFTQRWLPGGLNVVE